MQFSATPRGMSRRHFLSHLASASALALPAAHFTSALAANSADLQRRQKAAILLWMGGGPATIDIWDLKPGAPTGGPFKPISTSGDVQISEHMPRVAQQMQHLSIVRSMSTREADHTRGRYYMHTGYVPDPNIEYPSYGAVVAHELPRPDLEIPPFISVGGGSTGRSSAVGGNSLAARIAPSEAIEANLLFMLTLLPYLLFSTAESQNPPLDPDAYIECTPEIAGGQGLVGIGVLVRPYAGSGRFRHYIPATECRRNALRWLRNGIPWSKAAV